MDFLKLKARINKRNNQINISLPRKTISKKTLDKILRGRRIKVKAW